MSAPLSSLRMFPIPARPHQGHMLLHILSPPQALQLRRRVHGHDHPTTLESLHHLGTHLSRHGHHHRAVPLLRESLQLHQSVLGGEHPSTLRNISALATSLDLQVRLIHS
jgi:hypothetical protein